MLPDKIMTGCFLDTHVLTHFWGSLGKREAASGSRWGGHSGASFSWGWRHPGGRHFVKHPSLQGQLPALWRRLWHHSLTGICFHTLNRIFRGSATVAKGVVLRELALGSASPRAAGGKAAYYQTASLSQKREEPDFLLLILFSPFPRNKLGISVATGSYIKRWSCHQKDTLCF